MGIYLSSYLINLVFRAVVHRVLDFYLIFIAAWNYKITWALGCKELEIDSTRYYEYRLK